MTGSTLRARHPSAWRWLALRLAPWLLLPWLLAASGCSEPSGTAATLGSPHTSRQSLESLLGQAVEATVTSIQDGDSFRARTGQGFEFRVRLSAIDAPEHGQPHADQSKENLSRLIARHRLLIRSYKIDPFGRAVAEVEVDGQDVGLSQVQAGMAWFFTRYARELRVQNRRRYEAAETAARQARLGLWIDPSPIAPWDWRRGHPRGATGAPPPLRSPAAAGSGAR